MARDPYITHTYKHIPNTRVNKDQANAVGGHGATLTKYLLQVETHGPTQSRPLLL